MSMEERDAEAFLEPPDLARDRRLAEMQCLARMRQRAGIRHAVKDSQFVPIGTRCHRRAPKMLKLS